MLDLDEIDNLIRSTNAFIFWMDLELSLTPTILSY